MGAARRRRAVGRSGAFAAHPNHNAILVTHAYMYNDDTIYDWATKGSSQSWNPHSYGIQNLPGGVNDGQELWDEFVKKHDNFKFVFNGHVLGDGTGKRATLGDNGNVVHQILGQLPNECARRPGRHAVAGVQSRWRDSRRAHLFALLDRYNTAADQEFTLNMNAHIPALPPPLGHAVVGNYGRRRADRSVSQYGRFRDRSAILRTGNGHRAA